MKENAIKSKKIRKGIRVQGRGKKNLSSLRKQKGRFKYPAIPVGGDVKQHHSRNKGFYGLGKGMDGRKGET